MEVRGVGIEQLNLQSYNNIVVIVIINEAGYCDACFKIRFSNDDKFKDQLLQVTNLAKNKNDDID